MLWLRAQPASPVSATECTLGSNLVPVPETTRGCEGRCCTCPSHWEVLCKEAGEGAVSTEKEEVPAQMSPS